MKLNSKRFWIFEVMMLVACIITCVLCHIKNRVRCPIFFDWLWLAFICPPFLLGGAIVWKICKSDNWKKLAIWEIIITNLLLFSTMAILCIGSDGMTTGYAIMFSVICALSSILPILLCCYT